MESGIWNNGSLRSELVMLRAKLEKPMATAACMATLFPLCAKAFSRGEGFGSLQRICKQVTFIPFPRVMAPLPQGFDTPLQVFSSKTNASIGGLGAASRCRIGCSVTLPYYILSMDATISPNTFPNDACGISSLERMSKVCSSEPILQRTAPTFSPSSTGAWRASGREIS